MLAEKALRNATTFPKGTLPVTIPTGAGVVLIYDASSQPWVAIAEPNLGVGIVRAIDNPTLSAGFKSYAYFPTATFRAAEQERDSIINRRLVSGQIP